ncbi:capsular polysaccharide synthesis protein [Ruegeria sp. HKCCA5763]|uniref:capsular polysaccharide synthesis protein n=1 Tax=Ruegeria sp. HKCCA5763 TaxID=2682987 RepID=UPI0014880A34|nr:capsular polysaccharide synthesis protein [Ruegeria sp. HKCCA5763]
MLPTIGRRARKKLNGKPNHFAQSAPRRIPKTIWMYWDTGEADAPELVRHCIASWRSQNPDWDVRVLDATTVSDVVQMPLDFGKVPIQAYSDLLRFRLLREHGGVWVDATTYCLRPLDHWLPMVAYRGFFAFIWIPTERWFIWPGMYREIGTWFLASEPHGTVISLWEKYSFAYWDKRRKALVYYWAHAIVDVLKLTHRSFRRSYDSMPKIGCYGPHLVHDCVTHGHDPDEVAALLETGAMPVQKLRWNWSEERIAKAKKLLRIKEPG